MLCFVFTNRPAMLAAGCSLVQPESVAVIFMMLDHLTKMLRHVAIAQMLKMVFLEMRFE